ncbi:pilus assembly protein Flp/PilA [Paraburkholderia sp. BL23I1N1]|uniref:Flp family type IVb pilin n=1 Tax=Paraburkholderia madseniana TaxID=2599607 RepID=A0A6N6WFV4_9BURK|nr:MULTISPECIES: Flp family type IVb pilin [Paraburkholderia]KAE8758664.1 Flp family type IVb pilin [Paraburkholderia madseniana]RKE25918.1 pilus assembly protein Flp/PilA [Paraburkholderia sp. BL23I1N1]
MKTIINEVKRFVREEDGVAAIEYGLLAGLIAVMIIAGATLAGTSLNTLFANVGAQLKTAAANVNG